MTLRVLCVGMMVAGASAVLASPALADCSSPRVRVVPTEVVRGQTVTVVGTGMGTRCYDTGPPPRGEGVLGPPEQGVEILVRQGTRVVRVATADADDHYSFDVEVRVPKTLVPGPATVIARLRDHPETGSRPQVVDDLTIARRARR